MQADKKDKRVIHQFGRRKYLTATERDRFYFAALASSEPVYAFCRTLLDTGCRISEALNLNAANVDYVEGYIYFESLKKRKKGVFRRVPISRDMCEELIGIFDLAKPSRTAHDRLWNWSRMTGYRHVCTVMKNAGISGPQASPKGLRHGFAVAALEAGVPMNLVQRWLGHAHWQTTAIYADVVGSEERGFAGRLWNRSRDQEARRQPVDNEPFSFISRGHSIYADERAISDDFSRFRRERPCRKG